VDAGLFLRIETMIGIFSLTSVGMNVSQALCQLFFIDVLSVLNSCIDVLFVMNRFWFSVFMIEIFIRIEYQAGVFKVLQNLEHEN
jgi:hypothetical protein